MKSLEEYSTENKPSDKPPHALDNYDVEAIVRDMYNEYPRFNKLDMVYEVMRFFQPLFLMDKGVDKVDNMIYYIVVRIIM